MTADLHCHSTFSDGSLGIEEIIVQAKRTQVDFLSITDHDSLSSSSRAKVLGERHGVHIIPGVELSAWDKKRNAKVHILCYAPQKPERLEGLCLKSCAIRKESAKEMIEKITSLYPIPIQAILKYSTSSKSIFKQHIMRALVDYGYTTELYGELNNQLFNHTDGTCYVEHEYPDVNFVLDLIHSSKGIAVMAHPNYYNSIELLEELAAAKKLDGVEAAHWSNSEAQENEIKNIADKCGLIVTGGSDFHGLYNEQPAHIGCKSTDKENIDKLFAKIKSL